MNSPTDWEKVTESRYYEMLGALPPAWMRGESFLVGEPMCHRRCAVTDSFRAIYDGFTVDCGKFYATKDSVTVTEFEHLLGGIDNE